MKHKSMNLFIAFLILMAIPTFIFAQDIVTVPDQIDGNPVGAINKYIMGDTTSTGARNNPDRIYRLERGKIYVQDATMEINFNLTLIADDDDPNNPTRPPMLVRAYLPDGELLGLLFHITGDNVNVKFQNLLFQGIPIDRVVGDDWGNAIHFASNASKLQIDKCIFNGFGAGVLEMYGSTNYRVFLTNNVFRNLVQKVHPFGGQVQGTGAEFPGDSLVYTNNTILNINAYVLLPNKSIVKYIQFEHNTIFASVINPFFIPWATNAHIKNNIIYGAFSNGQLPTEISEGWYGFDGDVTGLIDIDTIDASAGINEADRVIEISNNAYGWPQAIKDYWNSIDSMSATPWMNERTASMFADDANYPHLLNDNNVEAEPGFDATMETSVTDSLLLWIQAFRNHGWDWVGGMLRHYAPNGDIFDIPWPLPENLTYSNTNLATASTDGLHLGDLNWYPQEKATWLTSIERKTGEEIPNKFSLSQNYPNPFNPTTVIEFSISETQKVTLDVYNALGQKVQTLVNKKLSAGSYKYSFNASKLSTGVYFYKIKTGNSFAQTKKMLLIK